MPFPSITNQPTIQINSFKHQHHQPPPQPPILLLLLLPPTQPTTNLYLTKSSFDTVTLAWLRGACFITLSYIRHLHFICLSLCAGDYDGRMRQKWIIRCCKRSHKNFQFVIVIWKIDIFIYVI